MKAQHLLDIYGRKLYIVRGLTIYVTSSHDLPNDRSATSHRNTILTFVWGFCCPLLLILSFPKVFQFATLVRVEDDLRGWSHFAGSQQALLNHLYRGVATSAKMHNVKSSLGWLSWFIPLQSKTCMCCQCMCLILCTVLQSLVHYVYCILICWVLLLSISVCLCVPSSWWKSRCNGHDAIRDCDLGNQEDV